MSSSCEKRSLTERVSFTPQSIISSHQNLERLGHASYAKRCTSASEWKENCSLVGILPEEIIVELEKLLEDVGDFFVLKGICNDEDGSPSGA